MAKKQHLAAGKKPGEQIHCAGDLVHETQCVDGDIPNCDIWKIFDKHPEIQCLPVTHKKQVIGLINRESFMTRMAGRFHWEIYGKKRCTKMMDESPPIIAEDTPVAEIASLLIESGTPNLLGDNFIVTRDGDMLGIGYTSDVMATLLLLERQHAEISRQNQERLHQMVEERTGDLLQAKLAAEQANRAKTEFLANISHELRTPLHGVLAFARLGQGRADSTPPEKLSAYFEKIVECANRLSRLVNDLLDLSSFDAGKMTLNRLKVDLSQLVDRAIADLSALAAERQVHIHCEKPGDEAMADCDPERIAQVLRHVIGNAIKFSPKDATVTIRIRWKYPANATDRKQAAAVLIYIVDCGPGIPERELESIFEHFTQSSTTRTGAGGKGLGLAISREILRLHGGTITARNNPEGGACFIVALPVSLSGDS